MNSKCSKNRFVFFSLSRKQMKIKINYCLMNIIRNDFLFCECLSSCVIHQRRRKRMEMANWVYFVSEKKKKINIFFLMLLFEIVNVARKNEEKVRHCSLWVWVCVCALQLIHSILLKCTNYLLACTFLLLLYMKALFIIFNQSSEFETSE